MSDDKPQSFNDTKAHDDEGGFQRPPQPSRAEHLAWCKKRALEYCDMGDVNQAFTSMASDLGKHPETKGHAAIQLGMMILVFGGYNSSPAEMRKFIEGFN